MAVGMTPQQCMAFPDHGAWVGQCGICLARERLLDQSDPESFVVEDAASGEIIRFDYDPAAYSLAAGTDRVFPADDIDRILAQARSEVQAARQARAAEDKAAEQQEQYVESRADDIDQILYDARIRARRIAREKKQEQERARAMVEWERRKAQAHQKGQVVRSITYAESESRTKQRLTQGQKQVLALYTLYPAWCLAMGIIAEGIWLKSFWALLIGVTVFFLVAKVKYYRAWNARLLDSPSVQYLAEQTEIAHREARDRRIAELEKELGIEHLTTEQALAKLEQHEILDEIAKLQRQKDT